MEFDINSIMESFYYIIQGLPVTLFVTICGLFLAFFVALTIAIIRLIVKNKLSQWLVSLYILFFTGTPLLFQYFIFYFGHVQFEFLQNLGYLNPLNHPYFVAVLVTGLNSGAYTSYIFVGAMENIDRGQWECCKSMGLTRWQAFKLLFPYAFRRVLPSYSNEIILAFKGTSLVALITVMDLFGYAKQLYGETYDGITTFSIVGVIYLVISLCFYLITRTIEKVWLRDRKSVV